MRKVNVFRVDFGDESEGSPKEGAEEGEIPNNIAERFPEASFKAVRAGYRVISYCEV